ncbi:unnamed protein product [Rotaria socialis]|uniref:Uncharacterized protein n=1 Tax=Rotaria socialis TaxID=392032 RepID=A0A820TDM3_9BILA|nr:unnamed protein product [Rotaria socialis]
MGVNMRLNQILRDSIFTSCLTLLRVVSNNRICPLPDTVLDRFCLEILPKIHNQIKWLNLESLSLERILLTIDYPNLSGLGVYNIDEKTAISVFKGSKELRYIDFLI